MPRSFFEKSHFSHKLYLPILKNGAIVKLVPTNEYFMDFSE